MRLGSTCTGTWRSPRCQASRASAATSAGARLDQRLRRGDDFHQAAVIEQQHIVGAQTRRRVQINLESAAFDAGDGNFLRAALGVIEDHGVDDRPIMAVGRG